MIENYKGWEITLTWHENNFFNIDSYANKSFNQNRKWVGIDFSGHKIYGASLKEIRHMIDYPNLHNKQN